MLTNTSNSADHSLPVVEIHIPRNHASAAASGQAETRLSHAQVTALQLTLTTLVSGFRPPEEPEVKTGLRLDSLEVALGFKIETGSGSVLKLLLDASAEASITAKVVWSRPK